MTLKWKDFWLKSEFFELKWNYFPKSNFALEIDDWRNSIQTLIFEICKRIIKITKQNDKK